MRLFLSLIIIAFVTGISGQDFRCDELMPQAASTLRTYEYTNPKNKTRGVACVSFLNNSDTILMYLEEETLLDAESKKRTRKQAVGRAQKQTKTIKDDATIYSGIIHVIKNYSDATEDLFDLDNTAFTVSLAKGADAIATFSIKSLRTTENLVYIWQPRNNGVPLWEMHVDIPQNCHDESLRSFHIYDPIAGYNHQPDRAGLVCFLSESANTIKYYALGWRKAGRAGQPRKFVDFGSIRLASPKFLNIYAGKLLELAFPCGCDAKDLAADRLAFRESLAITAVKAYNANSYMIYGGLQEMWIDTQSIPIGKLEPANRPQFPLLPVDLNGDYSHELAQVPGLPGQRH